MSIPTGHFSNRRFLRPKSKSAQPKGRWFPCRRSTPVAVYALVAPLWLPNMRETSVRELEHSRLHCACAEHTGKDRVQSTDDKDQLMIAAQ